MSLRPNTALLLLLLALLAARADAQTTQATPTAQEAAYLADITKRAEKHVAALKLDDAAQAARVRDLIVKQYQALRATHELRDQLKPLAGPDAEELKAATDRSLKALHDVFVTGLATTLTPEQVEKVKDEMTYNVAPITYAAFQDMLPNLTAEQKAYVLAQLEEARELAMDGGSSKEKHAVFGKYKGRINNYLSKQGIDLKQANKEWAKRRKAREAGEKQPAGDKSSSSN